MHRSIKIGHNHEKIAGNIQNEEQSRWKNNLARWKLDIIMRKQQGISKIKDDVGEKGIESDGNWT